MSERQATLTTRALPGSSSVRIKQVIHHLPTGPPPRSQEDISRPNGAEEAVVYCCVWPPHRVPSSDWPAVERGLPYFQFHESTDVLLHTVPRDSLGHGVIASATGAGLTMCN